VISEVPADLDRLVPLLVADRKSRPANYAMCVISEGASIQGEDATNSDIAKPATQRDDASVGHKLAREIEARAGIGTVVQELAYLMRAGEPDALDRMVGFAFGGLAVQLIQAGETGRMVTLTDGNYSHVPADTLLGGTKAVDVEGLYDRANYRAKLARVQGKPMFLY